MPDAPSPRRQARNVRGRRTILLIAALAIAPVVASYAVYYLWPRGAQVNYGTLLATEPAPPIEGTTVDGALFRLADLRGRWVLVAGGASGCGTACEQTLHAMRQAHTMQGKDRERIVRVWLDAGGAAPRAEWKVQDPGLVVVRVPAAAIAVLREGGHALWLIDPLGNRVLAYPADPDIKGLSKDLARVLRASQIG